VTIDTNSKVEEIRNVQDSEGNVVSPANEDRQQEIADAVSNENGLLTDEVTTGGTTPEQLPSHSVPDGVKVLISYLSANSGDVYVGDDTNQPIALTGTGDAVALEVTDTAALYIQTPTAGDGVGITIEGGA